ncbi:DUF2905 domain-containing protein [Wolbachia endosymbiont (group A) of Sicus ferrugineus]|uniref:DUF2905 domain-containing protein n=1 Tax=Wolbachia endosymbiont (group A) of Sicus ferrugineus TaxID=2954056 RepID=UPI003878338D
MEYRINTTLFSIIGLLITGIGLLCSLIQKLGIAGDIYIEKGNFKLYFSITTSLLISCIVSLIMLLINRFR